MTDFALNGFKMISALFEADRCDAIAANLASLALGAVGSRRLLAQTWCQLLAQELQQHRELSELIPTSFIAVQCTYFEKSTTQNWLVASHQDLSIPVAERVDDAALSGWSEKEGTLYVHAPIEFLSQLVAIRLHIDSCGIDDGPLRVVPGSHQLGRIDTVLAASMRQAGHEVACVGAPGSALVMRPLLLHASSKTRGVSQRRVLHFLFGPRELPHGLRWHAASHE
jgi:Phytanoyl-CoA dioxygenase (PhyH)